MNGTKLESSDRRKLLRAMAAVGFAGFEGLFAMPAAANALRVGKAAPPATLVTLDGQHISTSDLLGRVVVLTFWATWCGPCRVELPLLSTYASEHAADGLTVLGFSLDSPDEDRAKVERVAHSLSFPVGFVATSTLPGYGRIWHVPVNFTIDRQGMLVEDGWKVKEPTWTPERLQRVVEPLLRRAG